MNTETDRNKEQPKVVEITPSLHRVSQKTNWVVSATSPKCPDELSFTERDPNGHINWWAVTPPKTDYWHAHQILGRAYAFDFLDLINTPKAEFPGHILSFIYAAMQRWSYTVPPVAAEAIPGGFYEVLSEYLSTGTANR